MKKYKLLKNIPGLEAGAIFEHRDYDDDCPDRGNAISGVMMLCWLDDDCQQDWIGGAFIFPGQLVDEEEWFEAIDEKRYCKHCGNLIKEQ